MDALTAAERARRGEVLEILRGRLIGTAETDDGIAFTLPAIRTSPRWPGSSSATRAAAARSSGSGSRSAAGAPVVLRIGGGPGVKEFLRQAFR